MSDTLTTEQAATATSVAYRLTGITKDYTRGGRRVRRPVRARGDRALALGGGRGARGERPPSRCVVDDAPEVEVLQRALGQALAFGDAR